MGEKKTEAAGEAPHALLRPLLVANAVALVLTLGMVYGSGRAMMALFQEDAAGEWATVWGFLLAGVLALAGLRAALREEDTRARLAGALVLGGLAAFGIAVAGEEISWGQRLLGIAPPEVFLARNYQQELNFHNFLKTIGFDVKWLVAAVAFLYGISWPFLSKEEFLQKSPWGREMARLAPPMALVPFHVAVVLLLIVQPHLLSDEAAELLLGLAFASDLALRVLPRELNPAPLVGALLVAGPVVLGLAFTPLADAIVRSGQEENTAKMRAELHELAAELAAAKKGASAIEHVHARLYSVKDQDVLALPDGGAFSRAREAEGAAERGRYYLDPWNNAYWLFAPRLDGSALVYSFGANRRRDASADDLADAFLGEPGAVVLPGDDEAVRLLLGQ